MGRPRYQTAPVKTDRMPPGVPYIVGNEFAERFSYYGMRSILVVFMTQYLLGADGTPDPMPDADARAWYHLFISAVYFFPLLGAVMAEAFLGKYRTVISLSLVYCAGNLALALDSSRVGLLVGLTLIAIGSGGIKPCVSANVGDQFGATNQHLIPRVFSWFYFAINAGSMISTLLIPVLLEHHGPRVAFAVPAALMFLATGVFWLGRHQFVHIPPGGWKFVKETFSLDGLASLGRLILIYLFIAIFWALYDQSSSAWVLQADRMDRHFLGHTWLTAQIQTINPVLILVFIPLFSYVVYPALNRVIHLTPLKKIGAGFLLASVSFLIPAWIDARLDAGDTVNIGWQLVAYAVLTAGEVLVSVTALEFSYTQAPRQMKALVMAVFNLSVTVGNVFTAAVNAFLKAEDGGLRVSGAGYYLLFAGLMFLATLVYIGVAMTYREKTYLQEETPQ